MPFSIVAGDITELSVDAIVNAANSQLAMGGGVCGAIFHKAGPLELQHACDSMAPVQTGDAVITPGFALPAKYIIHTVGPVYSPGQAAQYAQLLRSAYLSALDLAWENKCQSIAFPLISSGIFGYPKAEALDIAVTAIRDFLKDHDDLDVQLVMYDRTAYTVREELLEPVQRYVAGYYEGTDKISYEADVLYDLIPPHEADAEEIAQAPRVSYRRKPAKPRLGDLEHMISDLDEPFNTTLLRLIDAKGMTDAEVYKRANIDRRLFSKIRTGKGYLPSKRTILALAIALELNLDETDDLLARAGYTLSRSQKFDVIVQYFISTGYYDIYDINKVLFYYDQPLLGAS